MNTATEAKPEEVTLTLIITTSKSRTKSKCVQATGTTGLVLAKDRAVDTDGSAELLEVFQKQFDSLMNQLVNVSADIAFVENSVARQKKLQRAEVKLARAKARLAADEECPASERSGES